MSWTDPRTWTAGETVTAAEMNAHVRDNFKALGDPQGSYSPTSGNWTLGNGSLSGTYNQAGKLVFFSISLTLGSTSAITGTLQLGLPTVPLLTDVCAGTAHLFDTSAGASGHYNRFLSVVGGGLAGQGICLRDAGGTVVNATTPFTWATGDTVEISGFFEAS